MIDTKLRPYSDALLSMAPKIVESFRTDPRVDDLVQPTVLISCDGPTRDFAVVDRLEAVALFSEHGHDVGEILKPTPPNNPVTIVVEIKGQGGFTFVAPDPRVKPRHWPWLEGIDLDD